MKKLFLLPIFFLIFNALLAQKTVIFYNFSSQTVTFDGAMATLPNNAIPAGNPGNTGCQIQYTNLYGHFDSTVTLPSGGSYMLENSASTTRFPFYSPNTPIISQWVAHNSYGSSTTLSSNQAWLAYGNGQRFHYFKSGYSTSTDVLQDAIGTVEYCNTGFVKDNVVSNNGTFSVWYAENPVSSTQVEYVIMVLDN